MVAGYTEGRGSRKYFGALVLGLYDGSELKFIGSVGTGFDEGNATADFRQASGIAAHARGPFGTARRCGKTWIGSSQNWWRVSSTPTGPPTTTLRAPVFLSLRNDRNGEGLHVRGRKT